MAESKSELSEINILTSKTFISHYTPLTDRKTYLQKTLQDIGFTDIEWITENDIQHYDHNEIYDGSREAFTKRTSLMTKDRGRTTFAQQEPKVIEVCLQHIEIYKRIQAESLDFGIVFEDDVIFFKNFGKKFQQYFDELPPDWDVFYFGKGCGNHHSSMGLHDFLQFIGGNKHCFKQKDFKSRFADSYIMRKKAIDKILPTIIPFHYPIDWELNYQQKLHRLNIYWGEPTITKQGSKSGKYKSNLR